MERFCSFPKVTKFFRLLDINGEVNGEDALASAVGQCASCTRAVQWRWGPLSGNHANPSYCSRMHPTAGLWSLGSALREEPCIYLLFPSLFFSFNIPIQEDSPIFLWPRALFQVAQNIVLPSSTTNYPVALKQITHPPDLGCPR